MVLGASGMSQPCAKIYGRRGKREDMRITEWGACLDNWKIQGGEVVERKLEGGGDMHDGGVGRMKCHYSQPQHHCNPRTSLDAYAGCKPATIKLLLPRPHLAVCLSSVQHRRHGSKQYGQTSLCKKPEAWDLPPRYRNNALLGDFELLGNSCRPKLPEPCLDILIEYLPTY